MRRSANPQKYSNSYDKSDWKMLEIKYKKSKRRESVNGVLT